MLGTARKSKLLTSHFADLAAS